MPCPYECHGFPAIAVGQLQTRKNQCNASLIEGQTLGGGGGLLGGGGSGNLVVGLISALELARHSVEGLEVAVDHEEEGGSLILP